MKPAKSFTDLIVWKKSHQLVKEVYTFSKSFPKYELYGITSQLRRSIVSVPANIAEGFKRIGLAEKIRFLNIAQGSLEEARYYLILCNDLDFGNATPLLERLEEVSKILESYTYSIKRKNTKR